MLLLFMRTTTPILQPSGQPSSVEKPQYHQLRDPFQTFGSIHLFQIQADAPSLNPCPGPPAPHITQAIIQKSKESRSYLWDPAGLVLGDFMNDQKDLVTI